MEIWFGVEKGSGRLYPVEVERATENSLVMEGGRRVAIDSSYVRYYKDMAVAVAAAREIHVRRHEIGARLMERATADLAALDQEYGEVQDGVG
jgi:hypothetical protein